MEYEAGKKEPHFFKLTNKIMLLNSVLDIVGNMRVHVLTEMR